MAPLIAVPRPGLVKINSRYARRFSSVGAMPTPSNRWLQVRLLSSIAKRPLPGATMAPAVSTISCLFIGPLPAGDVGPVDAVLEGVLLAGNPFVGQLVEDARGAHTKPGDPVDGVHGQCEPVGLVLDGQLQRRVDVNVLCVAAHVEVALTRPVVRQPVDQPGIAMEGEDHRL